MVQTGTACILRLERKIWRGIFGDKQSPDGYEGIKDALIFGEGVYRQETKSAVLFFDVPLIVGKQDGTEIVKLYKYLQQNPDKESYWGALAKQGFKIMWRINIDQKPHTFEMRFSNVPNKETRRSEGRVDLKTEKIQRMIAQAPLGKPGNVLT
jgi:hypothetical protein